LVIIQSDRQNTPSPYSQRDCRSGKGDFGGVGWGDWNQQTEFWDAKPAPVTPPAGSLGLAVAGVAPSARAGLFRGAVASLPAFPQRLVALRHVVEASSRSLRRGDPPAVRFFCPFVGPAAPGRPWVPVPPVRKLSPVFPPKASGWHPLRRGGGVGPNRAPAVICFGSTPTPALSVRFFFSSRFRKSTP
jgi:hypothetical protein